MPLPIDYDILRLIWWVLLGVLLIGLAIMDGFDFGVATLLPIIAKNDVERRIVINTVGPFWEGNQVWLILGGGAIFAAWPAIYAVSFSGFYLAMFVILAALILRPVGFKFRSKVADPRWRQTWDICLFIGGFVPALLFGVAVGNVMQGVPFYFDETLRVTYTGTFFDLLNPFGLVCGIISLLMCMRHGALYLLIKTEDALARRSMMATWILTILLITALYTAYHMTQALPFDRLQSEMNLLQPSNPLSKKVIQVTGGYFSNFETYRWMLIAPALAFGGIVFSQLCLLLRQRGLSFALNALSIAGIVAIPGLSMFPFILPSSSHPDHGLTIFDASSSHLTLFVMTIAAIIFIPIILAYTAWVHRILRGKILAKTIESQSDHYY